MNFYEVIMIAAEERIDLIREIKKVCIFLQSNNKKVEKKYCFFEKELVIL